jgi:hypothetical protein
MTELKFKAVVLHTCCLSYYMINLTTYSRKWIQCLEWSGIHQVATDIPFRQARSHLDT